MASDLAVCYVGDINFLLGSLISLRSLRRYVAAEEAEIYVFCLDADADVIDRLAPALEPFAAKAAPLDFGERMDLGSKTWNETHVPPTALGRFLIEPHLPAHIQRILYLDGDTLFVGDPSELIRRAPPQDGFAAAEDISYFARHDWGRYGAATRAYFEGLGIDGDGGYLNSGVLYAGRSAWRAVTTEALEFFERNSRACRYHDQSAINAVVGRRRVRLSPRWNFQTPFCYWNVKDEIAPSILHFTEFPKPWMAANVEPWTFVAEALREGEAAFAGLGLPNKRLSQAEADKHNKLKIARARRLASRLPVRLMRRRREIRSLARQAAI